jgi:hypothetical protein
MEGTMDFTISEWQERATEKYRELGQWLGRRAQGTGFRAYGALATMTLWPLVKYTTAAAQADQPLPLPAITALISVVGGVGGNLLANQVQTWYQEAARGDAPTEADVLAWLQENVLTQTELQTAIDQMLLKLKVIPNVQHALPARDWQVFRQQLTDELAQLGNLPQFQATLIGSSDIVQRDHNQVAGSRAVSVGGNVHGDIVTGTKAIQELEKLAGSGEKLVVLEAANSAHLNRLVNQVSAAATIQTLFTLDPVEAKQFVEEYYAKLAIVDPRLQEDSDITDTSGLELMKRLTEISPAKILITSRFPEKTKQAGGSAYLLHFATHGYFEGRKEVRSVAARSIKRGDGVVGTLFVNYLFSEDELESNAEQTATDISLVEEGGSQTLTPLYLAQNISPFLNALSDIQNIINEILDRRPLGINIRAIRQESPISVSLEGAVEAVQVVKDTVVPWRRKHAETMARLLEQEKLAEIESKKAEVLEKRANAAKGRAEAEKLTTEAVKQREEAEKMKLENEKMQLELHRARIQLGLDIINEFAPDLPETDRIAYLIRLLPALNTVIASNLQIVDDTAKNTN